MARIVDANETDKKKGVFDVTNSFRLCEKNKKNHLNFKYKESIFLGGSCGIPQENVLFGVNYV